MTFKDRPARSLDPLEVMALRAIAEHGGWTLGTAVFANYSLMIRGYGLPDSREALREYLQGAR